MRKINRRERLVFIWLGVVFDAKGEAGALVGSTLAVLAEMLVPASGGTSLLGGDGAVHRWFGL